MVAPYLNAADPEVGFGTWTSDNPDISFSNAMDPEAIACGLVPGENVFTWTLNNGLCGQAGTDQVIVNYKFAPTAFDDSYVLEFAGNETFNDC